MVNVFSIFHYLLVKIVIYSSIGRKTDEWIAPHCVQISVKPVHDDHLMGLHSNCKARIMFVLLWAEICKLWWICSFPMTGERENTCLILCQFPPLLICRLLLSRLQRRHHRALSAQWYWSKCCVKHVPLWHLLHCNRSPTRPASAGSHFKMSTLSGLQAIISSVISEWTSAPELQEMLIQVITAALLAPVVAGRGRSPLWGL